MRGGGGGSMCADRPDVSRASLRGLHFFPVLHAVRIQSVKCRRKMDKQWPSWANGEEVIDVGCRWESWFLVDSERWPSGGLGVSNLAKRSSVQVQVQVLTFAGPRPNNRDPHGHLQWGTLRFRPCPADVTTQQ